MPYSAVKVANEFLRLAAQEQRPITPLQLIKLVYISHGWSLGLLGSPLLNEQAQAWQYGPVIPSLYHAIKNYGASPISELIPGDSDPQVLSGQPTALINAVYNRYKHLSGTQLSGLTHMPNTPWSRIWDTHGKNAVIPDDIIRDHYASKVNSSDS